MVTINHVLMTQKSSIERSRCNRLHILLFACLCAFALFLTKNFPNASSEWSIYRIEQSYSIESISKQLYSGDGSIDLGTHGTKLAIATIFQCPREQNNRKQQADEELLWKFQFDHLFYLARLHGEASNSENVEETFEEKEEERKLVFVILDSICDENLQAVVKKSYKKKLLEKISQQVLFVFVFVDDLSGDELKTLFRLNVLNIFAAKIGVEGLDLENIAFYRVFKDRSPLFYNWFDSRLIRNSADDSVSFYCNKLVFLEPGFIFRQPFLTESNKHMSLVYQLASETEMKPFKIRIERDLQQTGLITRDFSNQTELEPGHLTLHNVFKQEKPTLASMAFTRWYMRAGHTFHVLDELGNTTTVNRTQILQTRSLNFMYLNFDSMEKMGGKMQVDAKENNMHGEMCYTSMLQGYLKELLSYFDQQSVMDVTQVVAKKKFGFAGGKGAKIYEQLAMESINKDNLLRCIEKRQFTYGVLKSYSYIDKSDGPSANLDFSNSRIPKFSLIVRTHLNNPRIQQTINVWTRDLSQVSVPLYVNVVSKKTDLFHDIVSKGNGGFTALLVNQSRVVYLLPREALAIYGLASDRRGVLMFTVQLKGVHVFSIPLHHERILWLWCQLTWAPLFSKFMLENEVRRDGMQEKHENQKGEEKRRYFWLVDYDVAFTGNISMLIELTKEIDADLLAPSQVILIASMIIYNLNSSAKNVHF